MTALLLLMIAPIGVAGYRVLASRCGSQPVAVAGAAVVALLLTVVPAYALRTKPSRGRPTDTPDSPAFVDTVRGFELQVAFGEGWSLPEPMAGQTVRRFIGHSELTVGPLVSRRPRSTLTFQASTSPPSRLGVRFEGRAFRDVQLEARPTRVAVDVPGGDGPAVLKFSVASGGVVTVLLGNIRATARRGG